MKKSLLDLHTDYLTSAFCQTTVTAPSLLPGGEISHGHVTSLLASPAKTGADLLRVVEPLAWQIESRDGVSIPNDGVEENPPHADDNELVCRRLGHAKELAAKGVNFLIAFYSNAEPTRA